MAKEKTTEGSALPVIGLPRAMLYYRYRVLWTVFFRELGIKVVVSPPTTLGTLEKGEARAIDEMCLSTKIYLGHVETLIGKCDYILVPRISNFGIRRSMCTKFEALYDVCRNVFDDTEQRFLSYNVDVNHGLDEETAFVRMAEEIGIPKKAALRAYKKAKKTETEEWRMQIRKQESLRKEEGLKILIAAHSYVVEDAYIGKPVTDYLKESGVVLLRADISDRKNALKQSSRFSPTLGWEINREIAGGVTEAKGEADGIILMSVFPCGPDSMANEMIIRRNNGIPILNLVLDGQSGMAGVETRLESFVDILRFRHGNL